MLTDQIGRLCNLRLHPNRKIRLSNPALGGRDSNKTGRQLDGTVFPSDPFATGHMLEGDAHSKIGSSLSYSSLERPPPQTYPEACLLINYRPLHVDSLRLRPLWALAAFLDGFEDVLEELGRNTTLSPPPDPG